MKTYFIAFSLVAASSMAYGQDSPSAVEIRSPPDAHELRLPLAPRAANYWVLLQHLFSADPLPDILTLKKQLQVETITGPFEDVSGTHSGQGFVISVPLDNNGGAGTGRYLLSNRPDGLETTQFDVDVDLDAVCITEEEVNRVYGRSDWLQQLGIIQATSRELPLGISHSRTYWYGNGRIVVTISLTESGCVSSLSRTESGPHRMKKEPPMLETPQTIAVARDRATKDSARADLAEANSIHAESEDDVKTWRGLVTLLVGNNEADYRALAKTLLETRIAHYKIVPMLNIDPRFPPPPQSLIFNLDKICMPESAILREYGSPTWAQVGDPVESTLGVRHVRDYLRADGLELLFSVAASGCVTGASEGIIGRR